MVVGEQKEPLLRLVSPKTDLTEPVARVRHGEGGEWCATEPVRGEPAADIHWQLLSDMGNCIKNILMRVSALVAVVFAAKLRL